MTETLKSGTRDKGELLYNIYSNSLSMLYVNADRWRIETEYNE